METKNKSNIIVGDTSALISMVIESDSKHSDALAGAQYLTTKQSTILIPAEVLAETVNVLGKKFDRKHAIATGRRLTKDEAFIVVETNELVRSRALDLMEKAADSGSYIDCIVVATGEQYASTNIYGFDRYFKQQGFPFPAAEEDEA